MTPVHVKDDSKEVFWTVWKLDNGLYRLMLLNTDWTVSGNGKKVRVYTPKTFTDFTVREGQSLMVDLDLDKGWKYYKPLDWDNFN